MPLLHHKNLATSQQIKYLRLATLNPRNKEKLLVVTAHFLLQDGTFSLADFTDAFQENEVQRVIRAYENSISIDVHCATGGGGEWHKLSELPFVKHCRIRVNPTDILDSGSQAIKDFIGE